MTLDTTTLGQQLSDAELAVRAGRASFSAWWLVRSIWSTFQFGKRADRGPAGPAEHLEKEAAELRAAIAAYVADPTPETRLKMRMEAIDCLFLACDVLDRDYVGPEEAMALACQKLVVNRRRTWSPTTIAGAVEHVRE